MKKFCRDEVFTALRKFSTFKYYKDSGGNIMMMPLENNDKVCLEKDHITLILTKKTRNKITPPPELKVRFGWIKVPYRAEYIKYLTLCFSVIFRDFPKMGLEKYFYEDTIAVGLELRLGIPDLDYPDIPGARRLLERIDSPLLDSEWCEGEKIVVCFSEFLNNGVSFNIVCLGEWVRYNMSELIEERYYSRFVRPDFKAKYCGRFYDIINVGYLGPPLIFGKSVYAQDSRFAGL